MDGPKKRILIIDDEETVLSTMSDLLTFLGYDVRATSEPLDGLELLQRERFDLIIVDMIMPQVGGLALSKVIRREKPQIPILAISGHYEKLIGAVRKPEVDVILPKPVPLDTLKTTLNDLFMVKQH
jgi:CheY-like chemotaxis protein